MSETTREGRFGCGWCLKSGKFCFSKTTEHGLIRGDSSPLEELADAGETEFWEEETRRIQEHISNEEIQKLRNTPDFLDWNEVPWQVCCKDFMAYLGDWQPMDFVREAGAEKARELFGRLVQEQYFQYLWPEEGIPSSFGDISVHVFRCLHCQKLIAWEDQT